MDSEELIECIQEVLFKKNMNMYQLALAANISQSTLSNILHRQNAPSLNTLDKICSGLGMSLSEFFLCFESRHSKYKTEVVDVTKMYLLLSSQSRCFIEDTMEYLLDLERRT